MIDYMLIGCMTLMGAAASIFFKRASACGGFWKMAADMNLYIGGFLYVAAAGMNIIVLKHMDYSVVLPLTSVTYIWTMMLSYMLLKESVTKKKVIGVCCIVLGAVCVAS